MSELKEIQERLNTVIQFSKANMKLCKGFTDYLSNVSFGLDKSLADIRKMVDELKDEVHKLNLLGETQKHIYSDKEIYELKKVMSWNKLHEKTDIPTSTLQYRYKRYCKELGVIEDCSDGQD